MTKFRGDTVGIESVSIRDSIVTATVQLVDSRTGTVHGRMEHTLHTSALTDKDLHSATKQFLDKLHIHLKKKHFTDVGGAADAIKEAINGIAENLSSRDEPR